MNIFIEAFLGYPWLPCLNKSFYLSNHVVVVFWQTLQTSFFTVLVCKYEAWNLLYLHYGNITEMYRLNASIRFILLFHLFMMNKIRNLNSIRNIIPELTDMSLTFQPHALERKRRGYCMIKLQSAFNKYE